MFESIEEVPFGSGCCAQVHRAILRDSKEKVAVKILHPNIRELFFQVRM